MDAMTWANSQHGNPLISAIAADLLNYGFTEAETGGLLVLLSHNIHLYVKHP